MKKWVKYGFPIACVVIVGGTLISVGNLKNKADEIHEKKVDNTYNISVKTEVSNKSTGNKNTLNTNSNVTNTNPNTNTNTNTITNTNIVNNSLTNTNSSVTSNVTNTNKTTSNTKTEETDKDLDKTDDKDKAIAMVAEEWGEDSSVYYTNEGISSGYYIVAVRDKSNTSVKMFYKVDLTNHTVEVDW